MTTHKAQIDRDRTEVSATKAQYDAAQPILDTLDAVADDQGTIQASDALKIMPHNRPEWHSVQSYDVAARRLGLERDEDGEWYLPAGEVTPADLAVEVVRVSLLRTLSDAARSDSLSDVIGTHRDVLRSRLGVWSSYTERQAVRILRTACEDVIEDGADENAVTDYIRTTFKLGR